MNLYFSAVVLTANMAKNQLPPNISDNSMADGLLRMFQKLIPVTVLFFICILYPLKCPDNLHPWRIYDDIIAQKAVQY